MNSLKTKYKTLYLLCFCLMIFFTGCRGGGKQTEQDRAGQKHIADSIEAARPKFSKQYPDFDLQVLKDSLRAAVPADTLMQAYYETTRYTPLWIKDTFEVGSLGRLMALFSAAGQQHGLPEEYFKGWETVKTLVDSIDGGAYVGRPGNLYNNLVRLEQMTSQMMIRYAAGMQYGFLTPDSLFYKNYTIKTLRPDSAFYADLFVSLAGNPLGTVTGAQPKSAVYLRMQAEYHRLDSLNKTGFEKIKVKGANRNYKLDDKDKNISLIADRLMLSGEYTPDTLSVDSLHYGLNQKLLDAINRFRVEMSYPEDKEVGKMAIDALNRPFTYYQERLRANMERYRWKREKQPDRKNIEVNIASFRLVAAEEDSLPLLMNVCVGKPIHKTPVLQSDMSYINLNPKWNIPRSIIRNETLISQKQDTSYLRRQNMRLYDGNEEIDPSTIDWAKADPRSFNYLIRQDPGDYNSLGRIKFMFINPFSVYLHDTPSKRFFNYKNRAVSHGCVRVQKPVELALFCLSPVTDLYTDRLLYSIGQAPVTAEGKKQQQAGTLKKLDDIISLQSQISLFIDYYTVYMLPGDSTLYYADDVYGYDTIILNGLQGIKPEHPDKTIERKGV